MEPLAGPTGCDLPDAHGGRKDLLRLSVGALGIVYGDIGTSPLYAIRECFVAEHGIPADAANVLGVLSLVFWMLTVVVVVKYLTVVMRADNRGEGGIFALMALIAPKLHSGSASTRHRAVLVLGLLGAALLFADGMITPAISVLSAVEGLGVATSRLQHFVVPISLVVLLALFLVQRHGTGRIGSVFGPVMFVWFVTIAVLGLLWIVRQPQVLAAFNPLYAVAFFVRNSWMGFLVLGAVVLCITGAEALYADLGHFGKGPIRLAWYLVVFPALILNYFGQGAVVLEKGREALANPFYALAPGWTIYPLVGLATVATVIASQALISGMFSLGQQAMQLGYFPRLNVVHTSSRMFGQIYVPGVNMFLMLACLGLVLGFQQSTNLAAAYGIAVTGTMAATSVLLYDVAREKWKWGVARATVVAGTFLVVDLLLLSGNAVKVLHGGYVPVVAGAIVFAVLSTWRRGQEVLQAVLPRTTGPTQQAVASLGAERAPRVRGTAVVMMRTAEAAPMALLHHFKHNKVLHERVVLMSVVNEAVPMVPPAERVDVKAMPAGFYVVTARYGFMEHPNMPEILRRCEAHGLSVDVTATTFLLRRVSLLPTGRTRMARWRKRLFAFMQRNEQSPDQFYEIPPNRVMEIGMQVEF